ncbi:MAG: ABC transporter permease [Corynebacterium casei]|uniref:ABC transporter permease n=1 Tax=Corynebacterium casei TaxID=160386 RepID=UPI0026476DF7|nr:ABC transporter permease [Corynebacterium casei]MDN5840821.1 ABC transporter permease [Corynebacterium casei]MDN6154299.1 ABC transporter permease [Corynebacterium casei]
MTNQTSSQEHVQSRLRSTNRRHKGSNPWTSPGSIVAIIVLVIAFAWALFPSLFTSADPYAGTDVALQAPNGEHWMGTDAVGRDVYSRIVYGAQQSLFGALIAVAVGLLLGTLLGLVAGTCGGWVDSVIMRIVDVLLSIPGILLSLSIIIILGFGSTNAAFAVGMTSVATFARLSRSQVMTVAKADFIEAAYGSGASGVQVLFKHILPNSLTPVIALATLQFGSAILQLAILGFLGYGAPPPIPEWGLIIADGRDFIATAWWVITFPGLAIIAVVMAANHLSHNIHTEA